MNLNLELSPALRNAPAPLLAEVTRELTPTDLDEIGRTAGRPPGKSPLKRLSDRHRNLARVLASGQHSDREAAVICGYTPENIYLLRKDPAFMNLLEFYRNQVDYDLRQVHERISGVTVEALDLITERLEDEEERKKITTNQALEIAKMGADRIGHGPQSSSVQVNINANLADRLKAAREQAKQAAKTIDLVPNEAAE